MLVRRLALAVSLLLHGCGEGPAGGAAKGAATTPIDYRARVSELEASLSQAQSDVKRLEALGDVATREELELARTRLAEAKAQRSLAGQKLVAYSLFDDAQRLLGRVGGAA